MRMMRPDRKLVAMAEALDGDVALELGGPSALFEQRGQMPVYGRLAALDMLDYSEHTLWSDDGRSGPRVRRRMIGEARRLQGMRDGEYDALLASHVLEHVADPLGALGEWQRVVRPWGHILLVIPHYEGTFDHRRPVTTLEHLREDATRETGEDDMTHLPEILALHDLERDPGAGSRAAFEARCRDNEASRGMHHHVFDSRAVVDLCRTAGLSVLALRPKRPFDIFCLCRVEAQDDRGIDDREVADMLAHSPFKSDRARQRFAPDVSVQAWERACPHRQPKPHTSRR
jgi:SAM-dependent methyltransferase